MDEILDQNFRNHKKLAYNIESSVVQKTKGQKVPIERNKTTLFNINIKQTSTLAIVQLVESKCPIINCISRHSNVADEKLYQPGIFLMPITALGFSQVVLFAAAPIQINDRPTSLDNSNDIFTFFCCLRESTLRGIQRN